MATAIRTPFRESHGGTIAEDQLKVAEQTASYTAKPEGGEDDSEPVASAEIQPPEDPDAEDAADREDPQERLARVIKEHDLNQLFVAFTDPFKDVLFLV